MNIYVLVEGDVGEKKVYKSWIHIINPSISPVSNINEVNQNKYLIVSGHGYPSYFELIEDAIEDVRQNDIFDRLVIAVDSEEMSFDEKKEEIEDFINAHNCPILYYIIIQHFCLETWALGNRRIYSRGTKDPSLRNYKNIFDPRTEDPELLPERPQEDWNRSQFAYQYLRYLLREKFRNLSYSKRNPKVLLHHKYVHELKTRLEETGHISSFSTFLNAFI